MRSSNSEIGVLIDLSHFRAFILPVLKGVLYNAQGIDPEILDINCACEHDSVSEYGR